MRRASPPRNQRARRLTLVARAVPVTPPARLLRFRYRAIRNGSEPREGKCLSWGLWALATTKAAIASLRRAGFAISPPLPPPARATSLFPSVGVEEAPPPEPSEEHFGEEILRTRRGAPCPLARRLEAQFDPPSSEGHRTACFGPGGGNNTRPALFEPALLDELAARGDRATRRRAGRRVVPVRAGR